MAGGKAEAAAATTGTNHSELFHCTLQLGSITDQQRILYKKGYFCRRPGSQRVNTADTWQKCLETACCAQARIVRMFTIMIICSKHVANRVLISYYLFKYLKIRFSIFIFMFSILPYVYQRLIFHYT